MAAPSRVTPLIRTARWCLLGAGMAHGYKHKVRVQELQEKEKVAERQEKLKVEYLADLLANVEFQRNSILYGDDDDKPKNCTLTHYTTDNQSLTEGVSEEQVSEEQVSEEQVSEEQVSEEQVSEERVSKEQVSEQQDSEEGSPDEYGDSGAHIPQDCTGNFSGEDHVGEGSPSVYPTASVDDLIAVAMKGRTPCGCGNPNCGKGVRPTDKVCSERYCGGKHLHSKEGFCIPIDDSEEDSEDTDGKEREEISPGNLTCGNDHGDSTTKGKTHDPVSKVCGSKNNSCHHCRTPLHNPEVSGCSVCGHHKGK